MGSLFDWGQATWDRARRGAQPPLPLLGKAPNSPVLTHSRRDEKHIQLFYLESGERMCEIKMPP